MNAAVTPTVFWFAPGTHNLSAGLLLFTGHTLCGASGATLVCPTLPADAQMIVGSSGVTGITVRNLVIDGAGSTTIRQEGLLSFVNAINATVQSCEVKNSAAYGVFLGNGGRISGCYIHDNGQGGCKAYAYSASNPLEGANNVIVEDSEICYNNTRKYQVFWEAGGFKMVAGKSAIVRRNFFHHNYGWGLWFDYTAGLHLVEDNLFEDETHGGITFEPSAKGSVDLRTGGNRTDAVLSEARYNTFRRVGWVADYNQIDSGLWGNGAIYCFSSANNMHHNYGEDLCNGVGYLQQPRSHGGNNIGGTVTLRSRTSNVATLTFSAAHGLVAGDPIFVQGIGTAGFDSLISGAGVFVASAPTTTTITYTNNGSDVASGAASGGALCTYGDPRYFSIEGSIETDNEWRLRTPITTSALTNPAFTASITAGSNQIDVTAGPTLYISGGILQGTGMAGGTVSNRSLTSNIATLTFSAAHGLEVRGGTVITRALTTNVATLTFSSAHGLVAGNPVTVSGIGSPFDGVFTVASAPTTTTLTYVCYGSNVASGAAPGGSLAVWADKVDISGVGAPFDTGAYQHTTLLTVPSSTTITYACTGSNVASGAAPGGAKAVPYVTQYDEGNIQSYHTQAATPNRYTMSARAKTTNAAASITIGTKYTPGRLGVSGLRFTVNTDRPPYEGYPGYDTYFSAVRLTIERNARYTIPNHPKQSKNYYETDGYWQEFRWGYSFMAATDVAGATNADSWTDLYPLDGPYYSS